jgi:hypothetical protein
MGFIDENRPHNCRRFITLKFNRPFSEVVKTIGFTEEARHDTRRITEKTRKDQRRSKDAGDFLEATPDVRLPRSMDRFAIWFFGEKDNFLDSVRHFGTCEKSVVDKELHVTKTFGSVKLVAEVNRDAVCIKKTVMKTVPVDEWDCQPLLSPAEIQQIGQERHLR